MVSVNGSEAATLLVRSGSGFGRIGPLDLVSCASLLRRGSSGIHVHSCGRPFSVHLTFEEISFKSFNVGSDGRFICPDFVELNRRTHTLVRHTYDST